jgi:hypothetical protein
MALVSYIVEIDRGIKVNIVRQRGAPARIKVGSVGQTMSQDEVNKRFDDVALKIQDVLKVHGGSVETQNPGRWFVVATTFDGMQAIKAIDGVGAVNPNGTVRPIAAPKP